MVERSVRRAKLFFILSDDFGELANALYLIHGQEFDPALLMPARLFALHQGRLAVRAGAYATVADVLAAVDRELPDIAFLFSGYLYVVNRILSAEGLETLIQGLCARDCRIAVSDPFLGLMGKRDGDTFADHPQKRLLIDIFDRVFAVLKPFPHLYLAELNEPTETSNVAFFNPQILVPPATRARLEQAIRHNLGIDPARRRWLFLLSHEEYGAQMMRYGRERFAELLANLLRQTIREG